MEIGGRCDLSSYGRNGLFSSDYFGCQLGSTKRGEDNKKRTIFTPVSIKIPPLVFSPNTMQGWFFFYLLFIYFQNDKKRRWNEEMGVLLFSLSMSLQGFWKPCSAQHTKIRLGEAPFIFSSFTMGFSCCFVVIPFDYSSQVVNDLRLSRKCPDIRRLVVDSTKKRTQKVARARGAISSRPAATKKSRWEKDEQKEKEKDRIEGE